MMVADVEPLGFPVLVQFYQFVHQVLVSSVLTHLDATTPVLTVYNHICCGVAKLPFTNNERNLKAQEPKPKLRQKQKKTKISFSTVNFSKVDPLHKCRSVSFYREASGLFTFREYPHVKRIKTECARLFLGSLQLGLHIIGAP
jgi:hypothetical protein